MTVHNSVRRLNNELHQLHQAKVEKRADIKEKRRALGAVDSFEPNPAGHKEQIRKKWDPIIKKDKADIRHERKDALHDLKDAQFHLPLKQLNRDRKLLGLHALKDRPQDTNTVAGCAQALLRSKNVDFWTGLSTGSDEKNFRALAEGKKAFVPATGQHVMPKLKMMQALVAMSKKGNILITALTGGHHSTNSNHYRGTAVDLGLTNAGMIADVARKYGGFRNSETSHVHLDF
jgi:hypothetical protein